MNRTHQFDAALLRRGIRLRLPNAAAGVAARHVEGLEALHLELRVAVGPGGNTGVAPGQKDCSERPLGVKQCKKVTDQMTSTVSLHLCIWIPVWETHDSMTHPSNPPDVNLAVPWQEMIHPLGVHGFQFFLSESKNPTRRTRQLTGRDHGHAVKNLFTE